jgi:hypothetical protein
MTINIEWQDQFGRWHHYQTKQNQADAYRVAQRRAESTKKRPRLVESDGRLMELVNLLQNSNPPGVNDDIACIFHQE